MALREGLDKGGQPLCKDVIHYIFQYIQLTPFQFGRVYQLVADKSKNIKGDTIYKRCDSSNNYISSLSSRDVLLEAYQISNDFKKRQLLQTKKYREYVEYNQTSDEFKRPKIRKPSNKKYNEWYQLEIQHDFESYRYDFKESLIDYFQLGRYVQFLLDTDNTVSIKDILKTKPHEIRDQAFKLKKARNTPSKGDILPVDYCNCGRWICGEPRCFCGSHKCKLIISISSLDYCYVSGWTY